MHPRIRARGLLVAVGTSALLAAPAAGVAKPKPPDGGAVRGETTCFVLTPGVAPGVITTTGRYTITPSGNGKLVCHGRVPQGPSRAIVVKGLVCPTPAGVTTKSHTVITPSGRVKLTCHFKAGRR
jgi:hypothetical protein